MKSVIIISILALAAQSINLASTSAFINFVERVNSGTSYEGTTVLLNVDIEFTESYLKRFQPIGKSITKGFLGIFNGQGHVIRDLVLNTTESHQYAGLFGHSRGAAIRNIVLDSSCSITSFASQPPALGGIIGYCQGNVRSCELENNVNMAQITFSGSLDSKLAVHLGGIAGRIYPDKYPALVRNCANYAPLTFSGFGVGTVYMGGIVGECRGTTSTSVCQLQNSLNYGAISSTEPTARSNRIGGVVGSAYYMLFDSCVNDGTINVSNSEDYTGALVGYMENSQMDHCFYSSTVGGTTTTYPTVGKNESSWMYTVLPFNRDTYELGEEIKVSSFRGKSLIGALNGIARLYYLRDYSNWTTNTLGKKINFTISKDRTSFSFVMDTRIILLPGLASESKLAFSGWYTDEKCTNQLANFAFTQDTNLYTRWQNNRNRYMVTFDTNGGPTLEPLQLQYLAKTTLRSDITKNGCPISHWVNIYGEEVPWEFTMPNHYVNLTAVWKCEWIASLDEFVAFSDRANAGEKFEGKTIALTSDIVFTDEKSRSFNPISGFIGTFDGQGHSIRNLMLVNSSHRYVGIFGTSTGTTIRNLIIADSVFSSDIDSTGSVYIGSAIGRCDGSVRGCTIENVVSTAEVEFYGTQKLRGYLYMGGIAGYTSSSYNKVSYKNCANYGKVTLYGVPPETSRIGGIVGYCFGSSSLTAQIVTCVNYNDIVLNFSESSTAEVGGLAGRVQYSDISFSLSIGKISLPSGITCKSAALCGNSQFSLVANNFYVDDIGPAAISSGTVANNSLVNSSTMDFTSLPPASELWGERKRGETLLDVLNSITDFYFLRGYSHWALNLEERNIKFVLNNITILESKARFVSLPVFSDVDRISFDGWYTDETLKTKLSSYTITKDITLYGKWAENNNEYTIRFREEGGTPLTQIKSRYGTTLRLPEPTRTYHVFKWWVTDYGEQISLDFTIPARDVTLYAVWVKTHILNAAELIEFGGKVKSGSNYIGETIYLENDIDFGAGLSTIFSPIGDLSMCFSGTFDGQGHVISNLELQTSSSAASIFGYSDGVTIRNIVVDSSCSITSSFKSSGYPTRLGGVLGHCVGRNSPCIVENTINMVNFEYIETLSSSTQLHIGGVIGCVDSGAYGAFVKNCVNYGSLVYTGGDVGKMHIGGIVGSAVGSSVREMEIKTCRIVNCLNSGPVIHKGFTGKPGSIGGIVGNAEQLETVNCANTGNILDQARSSPNYVGAIIGNVSYSLIDRCYFAENSVDKGTRSEGNSIATTVVSNKAFGDTLTDLTTTMNALNTKADEEGWSKWATNSQKNTIKFAINCRKYVSTSSPLIIYPELTGVDKSNFYGWYTDTRLTTLLSGTDINIGNSTLYAKWKDTVKYCSINITFEYMGNTSVVGHNYEEDIKFPQDQGASSDGKLIWFTDPDMEKEYTNKLAGGEDITLYGKKVPSKFVVAVPSLTDSGHFDMNSFDEKGTIKGRNDLCLDELCEEEYKGGELDEDKTLFKK